MTALYARTVTDADIVLFAGISGDVNPVHLNHEFRRQHRVRGPHRPRHAPTASFISDGARHQAAWAGLHLPLAVVEFKAPVRAGDTVSARVTILEVNAEKRRVTLAPPARWPTRSCSRARRWWWYLRAPS